MEFRSLGKFGSVCLRYLSNTSVVMAILEVLLIRKFFGRVRSNGTLQEFVVRVR